MILKPPLFTEANRDHPMAQDVIFDGLLNEGSGKTIFDSSGRGNAGTFAGSSWAPGKFGPAASFDAATPELVNNGIFSAWTGDNPDGWSVAGESGTDPEVSEVGTGEGHGGSGTGMCNIYTSDGTYIQISQAINLIVGKTYELKITIDTMITGPLLVAINGDVKGFVSVGQKSFVFTAEEALMNLVIKRSGACNVTFDDVSIKAVPTVIEIPDHDDFSPILSPFSIAAWINMQDATNFMVATKGATTVSGEWRFRLNSSDKLEAMAYDEDNNAWIGRSYNTVLTAYQNSWIHIGWTYDGGIVSAGNKLFLNGTQVDDTDYLGGTFASVRNFGAPVYVGRYNEFYANGLIDNIAIWRKELTPADMLSLCRDSFRRFEPAPIDEFSAAIPWPKLPLHNSMRV